MKIIKINGTISAWNMSAHYLTRELPSSGDIEVHIASNGGDVFEGIHMFNILKEYSENKGKVTTVNMSICASIASFIFLAGDERKAYDNATIMGHEAWGFAVGNASDMDKTSKLLKGANNIIAKLYDSFQKIGIDNVKSNMKDEMWYMGEEELLASKFVTEILKSEKQDDSKTLDAIKDNFTNSMKNYEKEIIENGYLVKEEDAKNTLSQCNGMCNLKMEKPQPSKKSKESKYKPQGDVMDLETLQAEHPQMVASIKDDAAKDARQAEASRIKAVSAVIPQAHKDNEKVIEKLYDTDTTVESMKAFLYDLDTAAAKSAKEAQEASDEANKDMLNVSSHSDVKMTEDEELLAELTGDK